MRIVLFQWADIRGCPDRCESNFLGTRENRSKVEIFIVSGKRRDDLLGLKIVFLLLF
jgi:hypothetical protein